MRINISSVYVDDQDKAVRFYTQVLGFMKKTEIPVVGQDSIQRLIGRRVARSTP